MSGTRDKPGVSRTDWWCVRCRAQGTMEYPEDASVYDVIEQLREAHYRANEAAACDADLAHFRVQLAAARADGGEGGR